MSDLDRVAEQLAELNPQRLEAGVEDAWPLRHKVPPMGGPALLIEARSRADVERVMVVCSAASVPVLPVGGRSNVVGALVHMGPAVYLSLQGLDRIQWVNEDDRMVRCDAGVIGTALERGLAEHGLTTGMYPQSLALSTVGGWVATGAMGTFSGRYGGIEDVLVAVEVVLRDGTVIETPSSPRPGIGPRLAPLFVGAEGSLGVITSVILRASSIPSRQAVEGWAMGSMEAGIGLIRRIQAAEIHPAIVRLYDPDDGVGLTERGGGPQGAWPILIGVVGSTEIVDAQLDVVRRLAAADDAQPLPGIGQWWLEHRYDEPAFLTAATRRGEIGDAIDVVAWWSNLIPAYREVRAAILDAGAGSCVAHISHVYDQGASLYFVILVNERDDDRAARTYRGIWDAAMTTAERLGVSIVHHHGLGAVRRPFAERALGTSLQLMRSITLALDPNGVGTAS